MIKSYALYNVPSVSVEEIGLYIDNSSPVYTPRHKKKKYYYKNKK